MRRACCLLLILIGLAGCKPAGSTTVVWISIDGFRGDYLQKYHPPTLTQLAREGASTSHEIPIFPSLTFPNHAAQVTGRTVDGHGVPANLFYDRLTKQSYTLPDEAAMLRAEPIWATAKRQGLRVAVVNWPMSHAQGGAFKADYFMDKYDGQETDSHRLERVAQLLKDDRGPAPLRLIISYVSHVDSIGHRNGPDSQEMAQAVAEVDQQVEQFQKSMVAWFDSTHSQNDELYLLLTTDHGMLRVRELVNLELLIGSELASGARIVSSGPIASIYLDELSAGERADRARKIVEVLRRNGFTSAWPEHEIPADFHFSDPSRVGDVVALLAPGYNFTSQRLAATIPAAGSPGAHGYDPTACPEMLGGAIVWRYRHSLGGADLGAIRNTQWHATVAHMLGIAPAAGSDPYAVALP